MIQLGVCMEYPIMHQALSTRLDASEGIDEVISADDPADFLAKAHSRAMDVAVMGLQDPIRGVRVAHELLHNTRNTRSVLMLESWCDVAAYAAFRCGVTSVVTQPESVDALVDQIEGVADGTIAANRQRVQELEHKLAHSGLLEMLSFNDTDTSILGLLCDGMTDKEIAQRVYLSAQTIRNRVSAMLHKTGKTNRTQLALSFAPIRGLFANDNNLVATRNGCNCLMQHAPVAGY